MSDRPFGDAGHLPSWVFDVVAALERYEYEHPSTMLRQIGDERARTWVHVDHRPGHPDYGGWDWCVKPILDMVPREVRDVADHIAKYRRDTGR